MPIEGITVTEDIGVYVEEDGTPMIRETPGGFGQLSKAEVTYLCKWSERKAIYQEMRGSFAVLNGLGVPLPGHRYPEDPFLSFHSIGTVKPHGMNKTLINDPVKLMSEKRWNWPKYALLPVTYTPLDYAFDNSTLDLGNQIDPANPILGCRQRTEVNNSFIVVDNMEMEILKSRTEFVPQTPNRKVLASTEGIPANTIAFTLEYPRVPQNPWRFLRPYLGTVNLHDQWDLPKGHVLFASVSVEETYSFGSVDMSATLTFIGNLDVGWNETVDDDGIVKPKVFRNNNGSTFRFPFRYTDHYAVFR